MTRFSSPALALATTALATASFGLSTITPAQASVVGIVSGSSAAAQIRHGMPASDNGAWARSTLTKLSVKPSSSMLGYSRALFPHWRDASTWGWPVAPNDKCDSRGAALYREGTGVKMSASCTNLTGRWVDAYSGNIYNAASDMDIDHVVPLGNAWVSGARLWSVTKKTAYANDPLVLLAVNDRLNQAKGDRSPDQWMPPNAAASCNYAERWVAIKSKYQLSVTTAERTKLTNVLRSCS